MAATTEDSKEETELLSGPLSPVRSDEERQLVYSLVCLISLVIGETADAFLLMPTKLSLPSHHSVSHF